MTKSQHGRQDFDGQQEELSTHAAAATAETPESTRAYDGIGGGSPGGGRPGEDYPNRDADPGLPR